MRRDVKRKRAIFAGRLKKVRVTMKDKNMLNKI
jgi:hypothetical protein